MVLAKLIGFFNICDDLFHNLSIDPNGKLSMPSKTDQEIEDSVRRKYDYLNPFKPTSLLKVLRKAQRYRLGELLRSTTHCSHRSRWRAPVADARPVRADRIVDRRLSERFDRMELGTGVANDGRVQPI